MEQPDHMSSTLRQMRVRLAFFDSDLDTAAGFYWKWHHPDVARDVLDKLYYNTIAPEITGQVAGRSLEKLWGGFAAIDQTWCGWYRLFDGGRDKRGRAGRYMILAALCPRAEVGAIDPTWMLTREPFQHLGENRRPSEPIVERPELELNVQAPVLSPLAVDPILIDRLRHDRVLQESGPGSASTAALLCNHLDGSVRWSIVIRGAPECPTVGIKLTSLTPPAPQKSPRVQSDLPVTHLSAEASNGKATLNALPLRRFSRFPFEMQTVIAVTLVLLLIVETARTGLLLFPPRTSSASVLESERKGVSLDPALPPGEQPVSEGSVPAEHARGRETTRTGSNGDGGPCFWRWAAVEIDRVLRKPFVPTNERTDVNPHNPPESNKQKTVRRTP
jgi:hypothetical protein